MAHKIKVTTKPHFNKDGSKSETKKDYLVTHRHRKTKMLIGRFTNRKAADEACEAEKVKTFGPQA